MFIVLIKYEVFTRRYARISQTRKSALCNFFTGGKQTGGKPPSRPTRPTIIINFVQIRSVSVKFDSGGTKTPGQL